MLIALLYLLVIEDVLCVNRGICIGRDRDNRGRCRGGIEVQVLMTQCRLRDDRISKSSWSS